MSLITATLLNHVTTVTLHGMLTPSPKEKKTMCMVIGRAKVYANQCFQYYIYSVVKALAI